MLGKKNKKYLFLKNLFSNFGKTKENNTNDGGIKLAEKYKNLAQKRASLRSETRKYIASPKDQKAKLNTNKLNILIIFLFLALTKIKNPKNKKRKEQQNNKEGRMSMIILRLEQLLLYK